MGIKPFFRRAGNYTKWREAQTHKEVDSYFSDLKKAILIIILSISPEERMQCTHIWNRINAISYKCSENVKHKLTQWHEIESCYRLQTTEQLWAQWWLLCVVYVHIDAANWTETKLNDKSRGYVLLLCFLAVHVPVLRFEIS